MNGQPLLEVRDIAVFYGPIQALRDVSLSIGTGDMVALLGANGAGKTTTLRTISGLIAPRAGSITLAGGEIAGARPHQIVAKGVAHLPEGRELFSGMSVLENLRLGAWTQPPNSVDEWLERVLDLFPRLRERATQMAGTLSGGEQQMLGVGRAMMSNPRLLIIDELSLGLAPKIVADLFAILRDVNAAGTAVLIVEQFVHMALANTHRAYVLSKGAVAMQGASAELLDDPSLVSTYLGDQGVHA